MHCLEKTRGNLGNLRDIKFVKTEIRRIYLASDRNYHITKFFTEHLLAIETNKKKTEIFLNKPVYLGLSVLRLSKIFKYEFWYHYVKPKYGEKCVIWVQTVSLYT